MSGRDGETNFGLLTTGLGVKPHVPDSRIRRAAGCLPSESDSSPRRHRERLLHVVTHYPCPPHSGRPFKPLRFRLPRCHGQRRRTGTPGRRHPRSIGTCLHRQHGANAASAPAQEAAPAAAPEAVSQVQAPLSADASVKIDFERPAVKSTPAPVVEAPVVKAPAPAPPRCWPRPHLLPLRHRRAGSEDHRQGRPGPRKGSCSRSSMPAA